eukprot:CAMPEP_0119107906 /NCGR_PEP_ID=MMETSP1180-20130426/12297_1 /TAXON_ID=3052 ORGANISM="Chlamydomonas cf sp, Strain CCMP681" /NCGR_SAMPLE_ID=MMETSP1180 /ASSEMBLY_ACC=CAM_ASM_000741 /LENGTH=254 /DNA_ID=CAMNT_0007093455 /DNA_START=123 /DNA_END=887 /DNA_ORIENTATION=-
MKTAEGLYCSARSWTPTALQPTLSSIESSAASVASPVLAKVQDVGEMALKVADGQVDYVLNTAHNAVTSGQKNVSSTASSLRQAHYANLKTFTNTSAAYFTRVQHFAEWAADKLNPIRGGRAALDAFKAAIEKAKAATDPDVAMQMISDAWSSFASNPVVAKVLHTADPVTSSAFNSFYKLHDNLVGWTLYKRVVDTGVDTLTWATTTMPYKLGAKHVYPLVQPVAEPALDRLTGSKVISSAVGYWKPTAAKAA